MTLEETTKRVLAAAKAQDLTALDAAAKERAAAIAALPSIPPSAELRGAVIASMDAGKQAAAALRIVKQRLQKESRRLAQIQRGIVETLGGTSAAPRIDYRG